MAIDRKSLWGGLAGWLAGCGCAVLGAIGLILIGFGTFFGVQIVRNNSDPVIRRAKSLEVLSAREIPALYESKMVMAVPFYGEVVLLEGKDRQLIYLKDLDTDADLTKASADDESFDEDLRRAGLNIRSSQTILARDALRVGAAEVRYILIDGEVHFDGGGGGIYFIDFDVSDLGHTTSDERDGPDRGAVFLVRCSAEDKPGVGLWMGPQAGPQDASGAEAAEGDVAVDQAALVRLVEQFGFCRN